MVIFCFSVVIIWKGVLQILPCETWESLGWPTGNNYRLINQYAAYRRV
jgi:hypothetical protein